MRTVAVARLDGRRLGSGLLALALVWGLLSVGSGAVTGTPLAGAQDQGGAMGLSCLDSSLRPADDCPPVDASVEVSRDGDVLEVTVGNAGLEPWPGGPVAVEVPSPGLGVDEPTGREDPTGRAGTAEWVTRASTVVSRCVFEPVTEIGPGESVSCRLLLLGLADGDHPVWLTGFVGGLPTTSRSLGNDAPAVGVVPVAEARSFTIRIDGGGASLVDQPSRTPRQTESEAPDSSVWVVALGGVALAGVTALGLWLVARARGKD